MFCFFKTGSIETPKIYIESFSFSHCITTSSAKMSVQKQTEDVNMDVRIRLSLFS